MHWTRNRAEAQLREDLDKLMEPYVRKASILLGMNQCEYDALTSFRLQRRAWKGRRVIELEEPDRGCHPSRLATDRAGAPVEGAVYGFDAQKEKRVKLADLVRHRERELHMFMAQRCPCDGVAQ